MWQVVFKHSNYYPIEADKWGAFTMGFPIGSLDYVKRALDDSDDSPLQLWNKDFDSLMILAARKPQLVFLF
jgi:hypothetical protein